ncbi:retrovirus-related pol polyprotein LINE-1 [Tanacetum coccineum]
MREGNNYKLWYSYTRTARNRVGVILASGLRDKVVHVNRCSDWIMSVSLVVVEKMINVMNVCAPQLGQRCDLNGHVRAAANGYSKVHEGFGYGVRNEEGHMILEFAIAYNFVVANSFFMKRDAI